MLIKRIYLDRVTSCFPFRFSRPCNISYSVSCSRLGRATSSFSGGMLRSTPWQTVWIPPSCENSVLACFILLRTQLIVAAHFRSLSAGWLLDELDFKLTSDEHSRGEAPGHVTMGDSCSLWWFLFQSPSCKAVRLTLRYSAVIKGLSASHAQLRASIKMCWLAAQCNIRPKIVIIINLIISTAKGKSITVHLVLISQMKYFLSLTWAATVAWASVAWSVLKIIPCGSGSFLQCLQESSGSQTRAGSRPRQYK